MTATHSLARYLAQAARRVSPAEARALRAHAAELEKRGEPQRNFEGSRA